MFGSNDWPLIPAHVNVQRPNPMAPRSSEEGPTKFVALRVPVLPMWAPHLRDSCGHDVEPGRNRYKRGNGLGGLRVRVLLDCLDS